VADTLKSLEYKRARRFEYLLNIKKVREFLSSVKSSKLIKNNGDPL